MKQLMELPSIGLKRDKTALKPLLIATPLVKLLAIPLGCQKALHSHSAMSPSGVRRDGRLYAQLAKYGDISRWLTATNWLVISNQKTVAKSLVIEGRR
ncbi:MAG TPA: hypothetical protein VFQ98_04395 [Gallionella sp.]|nr:hypothetical protein [Gallionella sp.]